MVLGSAVWRVHSVRLGGGMCVGGGGGVSVHRECSAKGGGGEDGKGSRMAL